MEDVELRLAAAGDFDGILELYRHLSPDDDTLFDRPQLRDIWSSLLSREGTYVCVAVEGESRPVSTCTLVVIPNIMRGGRSYALLENVVTLNSHRRRGLGRATLNFAIEKAWSLGCYKVMLMSGRADPGVHTFYRSIFPQTKQGYQVRNLPAA
ncbi:GNAT family N-acetyltransferase [Chelativorans sp. AA-79]|uniref:GNAT family N-acetyltransferase n=1 Tax=Chelativorans sp. AA-79 TaxID=3028735 RepID=UPI0023F6A948|nr:GNAT family N-acetyltransferase [Chelativorans sp. AA-79]WEX07068.1 GNAT family N-acetyltransferase [Chelativorans sp. AA-79]